MSSLMRGDAWQLRNFIEGLVGSMSDRRWNIFLSEMTGIELQKNNVLNCSRFGGPHIILVLRGAVQVFDYANGSKVSLSLLTDKGLYFCTRAQCPDILLKAYQRSRLWVINTSGFSNDSTDSIELLNVCNQLINLSMAGELDIKRLLIYREASERFRKVMLKNPDIFNCFPQKEIASYLGLNPATLSKVKALRY